MADIEVIDRNEQEAEQGERKAPMWRVSSGDSAAEHDLIDRLGVTPIQARLLVNRGIKTAPDAAEFLAPVRSQILSPFLFKNMERAVARIRKAIEGKEKIFIFGDKDVDGVAGTAILLTTLKAFGGAADCHIPRGGEGYGVHPDVMAKALREKFTLGITVDTGICEIERVEEATAKGMDVIIADHHEQKEILPGAYAILHPQVSGEPYPYKYLSGAGVAFKLAMALFASKSPYANRPIVFVDVETTGLNRGSDQIIEIGAIKYRNGVKLSDFSRLIAPDAPLSDEIRRITGITDAELAAKGVDRKKAITDFQAFVSDPGTLICGYNVDFDRAFLEAELDRQLGAKFSTPVEDVLTIASGCLPGLISRKLGGVAKELGVELTEAHRAMADAQAAADIFYLLLNRQDCESNLFYERLIPLAALAAVADMMPLTGENRAIVAEGLRVMRESPPLGLKHLLEHLELPAPNGKDLAFLLGPLLNAPGRLGDAAPALRLLTAASKKDAMKLAEDLVRMNTERKELVKDNFKRLIGEVSRQNDLERDRIICISAEGIPHGVTGIVATRIKNEFGRPVMITLIEDGMGVGSGRSIESLNLLEAVATCGDLLEKFGGHHQAVGVTVRPDRIPAFFERLKKSVAERVRQLPEAAVDVDLELSLPELTMSTLEDIAALEPFGKANPFPKFLVTDAPLAEIRRIGDAGRHLRLRIGHDARRAVTAVGWNMSGIADRLRGRIDAIFELSLNEWNGRKDIQMVLEDIRPAGGGTGI